MEKSLDNVLQYALRVGAVDLILAEGLVPALRVAGQVQFIPGAEALAFGDLEKFLGPLAGESGQIVGGPWQDTEWRIRYSREAFGKMAVLRPIGADAPTLSDLSLPETVKNLLGEGSGLILFAGQAVSGKTTTASAFVSDACSARILRASLLDPLPEYKIRTGNSLVCQKRSDVSFEEEIRQGVLAGTDLFWLGDWNGDYLFPALRAAAAGARVVATFSAGCARDVLAYFLEDGNLPNEKLARSLFAASLRAVIVQKWTLSEDGASLVPAWEVLENDFRVSALIDSGDTEKIFESPWG